MEEIWKDIPEYEGLYQVSNLGRIKRITTNKILKLTKRGRHYLGATLSKNGAVKTMYIHQLVAIAFLGHIPNGHQLVVDHINDNTNDNRVENLQIVTQRFNACKTQGKYSSKYKGVCWSIKYKKWYSHIRISGKQKHIGSFEVRFKY